MEFHKQYVFARASQSAHHLVDRGANGGLAGSDMRVIHKTHRKVNVVGINDHQGLSSLQQLMKTGALGDSPWI